MGNLRYAVWSFREAGQISEHDARIGLELACVLSGGEGPGREVSEWEILDLEREAFLTLLGTRKTQERIAHMLKTGKPLGEEAMREAVIVSAVRTPVARGKKDGPPFIRWTFRPWSCGRPCAGRGWRGRSWRMCFGAAPCPRPLRGLTSPGWPF